MSKRNQAEKEVLPELPTQAQAKQINRLEKARDNLHTVISKYRGYLKETTLSENRLPQDKAEQMQMFSDINLYTSELEELNVGEGLLTLALTSLNSVLVMKDEINQLKFQNYILNKKVDALSKVEVKTPEV